MMRTPGVILAVWLMLASISAPPAGAADEDGVQQRETAAARLFDVPLYRELATREIYEALATLPEGQRRSLAGALRDPKVVQALKQAILRSTAATYSVKEIELVHRFLAADEARSIMNKLDRFRGALLKEAVAAAIQNPELAPALPQQ
jgi:hypothetical protein